MRPDSPLRPRVRTLALTVVVIVASACGPFDPETRAHRAYIRQVQPLLVENSLLAERVLVLAADVYNRKDKVDTEAMARMWTSDVVPLAEHLHSHATFVEPPPEWVDAHGQLVDIWSDRAQAYRAIGESITMADPDLWKNARELTDTVKLREEEWFRNANLRLAPKSLSVDQFP